MTLDSRVQRGHIRKGHLTRGFTLIELLVVIAIIGILSAVVLASLNTARAKGTDAAIESDLNTAQTQAALDYDGFNQSYGYSPGSTSNSPVFGTATVNAATYGGGNSGTTGSAALFNDPAVYNALTQAAVSGKSITALANNTSFVIISALTANTGTYWCVDSQGISRKESTAPATGGTNYLSGTTYGCI
jgi:prepilin-type N-terminal cleavage/methylation domain-containing protein